MKRLLILLLLAAPAWAQTTVRIYGVIPAQSCTQGITISYGPTSAYGSTVTATRSGGSFFADISFTGSTMHYAVTACGNPITGDSTATVGTNDATTQAWNGQQDIFRAAQMKKPFGHATGLFHLEKITFNGQTRWWLISPTGNPYYMVGIQAADSTQLLGSVLTSKYGGVLNDWYQARNAQMLYNGFNALNAPISCNGLPVGCFGNTSGISPRIPFDNLQDGSNAGLTSPTAVFCGINEALKDIPQTLMPAWYTLGGHLLDFYDARHKDCVQRAAFYWEAQYTTGMTSRKCNPASDGNCAARWMLGITSDDGDNFSLFKGPGNGCVQQYPHIGFVVAISKFQAGAGIDRTNYSKRAWVNYLKTTYATIGALNTAWATSSFYTDFEDAGGYGTGTGVIDEDGRHSWFGGNGTVGTSAAALTLAGVNATLQTDLETFMHDMAKQYAVNTVSSVRTVDQEHILISINTINNYGEETRPKVLQGLSDGGFEAFDWNYDPGTVNPPGPAPCASPPRASMANNNAAYDLLSKPASIWYQVTASTDSADSGQPLIYGVPDHPPRSTMITFLNTDTTNFLNAAGTNSDRYVFGWRWWELFDKANEGPGEGILSQRDNPYNGVDSVTTSQTCAAPLNGSTIIDGITIPARTCGGETANFGNSMGTQKTINTGIYATLLGAAQP